MTKESFAGTIIFVSFILTNYSYFIESDFFIYSGILSWIALFLIIKKSSNIKLLLSLFFLSISFFLYSFLNGFFIDIKKALTVNQYLLTLLIGVGFLRLVASPKVKSIKALPKGENSFYKTYLGVHLFGSVINLSSLILVADKLYKKANLSKYQIIVLTRAFSSDAYWSPFFVAFAAALTYAPRLSTVTILFCGLILAIIAFLFTFLEVKKDEKSLNNFQGYPIEFETLYLPLLLAFLILLTNHYFPDLKVILLISLFSLILSILILPIKFGLKKSTQKLKTHISTELPKMKNEIALFLVAGMFGVSISSILLGLNLSLPFEQLNGFYASIILLVFILLSFIGIHPIISISVMGNWVEHLNHTLLAVAFLMSWATAVSTSPFSGLNLTMQARYNLSAKEIFKINLPYSIKMYFVCVIILFLLSKYLGL